ncbi:MAG TPA: GNAT family N-acetyltransferase [Chroococcales cyanobacterium]
MRSVETFATSRMVAERLRASDLPELAAMNRDPVVMASLGGVMDEEETRKALSRNLEHWDRNGYGLWIFREKATGSFVGRAGLRFIEVKGAMESELLYALRSEFWGRGLATEIGRELVSIGIETLELPEIVAFTVPGNQASRRVMEKVGFNFDEHFDHGGVPHVLYRLRASRY